MSARTSIRERKLEASFALLQTGKALRDAQASPFLPTSRIQQRIADRDAAYRRFERHFGPVVL